MTDATNKTGDGGPAVLTGRVVEVGDIECLQEPGCDAKAGLVILTTMDQLRKCGRNLAFAEVEVRLREKPEAVHA